MGRKWTTEDTLACRDMNGGPARVYRQITKAEGTAPFHVRFVLGNGERVFRQNGLYLRKNGETLSPQKTTLP